MTFQEFRDQYILQHPASVPQKPRTLNEYPGWLRWLVAAMAVSAAILSGVHTIPTVRATIEQWWPEVARSGASSFSFVAIEAAIFASAYLRRKNALLGYSFLVMALAVAITANITSSSKALNASSDLGASIVAVILGIGAPMLTFMAGEMFVHMHSSAQVADKDALEQYQQDLKEFDRIINAAWSKWQKEHPPIPAQTALPAIHSPVQRMNSLNSANEQAANSYSPNSPNSYSKRMDAREVISEFFRSHPERLDGKLDELMAEIEQESGVKVGRTSIHNVRRDIVTSMNGASHQEAN